VPYARKVPVGAVARAWPVREVNGGIFVYHGDGAPWAGPPEVAELSDPGWRVVGRSRWRYECHLLEMVDNAADPMHLVHLHGGLPPAVSELQEAGAEVKLTTRFLTDPARLGFAGEAVPARIEARLCGPGVQVIRFSAIVEGLVYLCFTPVERSTDIDARMVVVVREMEDEGMTAMVGELVRQTVVQQFEEDVRIWRHKVFLARPVLAEGDGPVGRVRRWARQFYGEAGR
jgi:3-ketosteroid 9alpha-monooxygenase subunit A